MQKKTYPITYAILGLLAFTGPMSGYDMKQIFDCTLSAMWNATQQQIYNELNRLADLGWAKMEYQQQETRPDRKVYCITAGGQAALRTWQGTQPARELQMRDEVLLRFMFGHFATREELATTLRASIAEHETRVAQYQQNALYLPKGPGPVADDSAEAPAYQESDPPDPFFAEMTRFAFKFEDMYLTWLREALAFVEARS